MKKTVPVNMSNKHLHLTQAHVEALFGAGHQLCKMKDLSQPGQFACDEKVDIVGPKGTLKGVRVLGPARPDTQVEISIFDARTIGVDPVAKLSGDIEGTPACTIVGPAGKVELEKGTIVALRHIHMNPTEAAEYGLKDKDVVKVKVGTDRAVTFENVIIRVNKDFILDMHIDIEEGNAAGLKGGEPGEIIA